MTYFFLFHFYSYFSKHKTNLNFTFYSINNKYKKFATKADVNKNAYICEIKPVKTYLNLNQPLKQTQFIKENRGKAGVYM